MKYFLWIIFLTVSAYAQNSHPFFVFDNGLDGKDWNQHATTLKTLGYDGVQYGGFWVYKERNAAMKKQELTVFSLYEVLDFKKDNPFPKLYYEILPELKGQGTII